MILAYCKNEIKFVQSQLPLKSIRIEVVNARFYANNSNGIFTRLVNPITVSLFSDEKALPQFTNQCFFKDNLLNFQNIPFPVNGIHVNCLAHEIRVYGEF